MDQLEIRPEKEREKYQFNKLRDIIYKAQKFSSGWREILKGVNFEEISDKASLTKLPIIRKSSLSDIQKKSPPFGGLTTIDTSKFKNLFVSPGPIYEPGGDNDFWRMSRAMNAACFSKG